ncbi:ATP-binding cassette domain-containing protein, partial [Microbispora sp. H10830]|uniref:ATP-binding cassette domain-containing protein n=1 Tax=Microbispora sp. H10830 TaxID=2729109 RepID=UPI001601B0A6
NITLASLSRYTKPRWLGWLDRRGEFAEAKRLSEALDIRPPDPRRPIRTLSGGNQQKAVLGRWLAEDRKLLLLDEPTRGVDVGARAELYALVRKLADDGIGVLLVSSEVPEVLGLADRVLVVREGRIVHEAPAEDLDEHRVLDLVMVSARETPAPASASDSASTSDSVSGSGPVSDSGSASDSASDSGSVSDSGSGVANPPSEGAFDD